MELSTSRLSIAVFLHDSQPLRPVDSSRIYSTWSHYFPASSIENENHRRVDPSACSSSLGTWLTRNPETYLDVLEYPIEFGNGVHGMRVLEPDAEACSNQSGSFARSPGFPSFSRRCYQSASPESHRALAGKRVPYNTRNRFIGSCRLGRSRRDRKSVV